MKKLITQPKNPLSLPTNRLFWAVLLLFSFQWGWGQSVLVDDFTRGASSNTVGNSWFENETVASGARVDGTILKCGSTTAGREFVTRDMSGLTNAIVTDGISNNTSTLVWAFNFKFNRTNPGGFANGSYGLAFVLAKTNTNVTDGSGYAVVIGQSGTTDAIRLVRFTGGVDADGDFANIISGGDYANEYISVKVTYDPTTDTWSLYAESNSSAFPQSDPRNTTTQIGSSTVNTTYTATGNNLKYCGPLYNHSTASDELAIYDDVYMPITACTPPTTQASAFTSSAITETTATVGWTNGNGDAVLVVAHQGSAVNADPENGTAYTADAAFGSGTQIGTGNYVVYNDSGTSVNLTGLTHTTAYHFAIYSYNSADECYHLTELTGNFTTVSPQVNWCNVQYPTANQDMNEGNTLNVYAQVHEPNVTPGAGQGANINAWIGYSSSNSDPSGGGWSWIAASYSSGVTGNNDEYTATLGSGMTPGTYYYASRFQYNGGNYVYGGKNDAIWASTSDNVQLIINSNKVDWCNVSSPESATILEGNSINVYAKVYEPGVTEAAGQGAGISGWIGYSSTNDNPANVGWTWVVASFHRQVDNNDEYVASSIGSNLETGVYYFASRFQKTGSSEFLYGGYSAVWDNNSGVLTIQTPEINVKGNGVSITDGDITPSTADDTNFGSAPDNTNITKTFTIENLGNATLNISNIQLTTGDPFSLSDIGLPINIAASSSTTFTITFNSLIAGTFPDTLTITSDDANEGTYTFDITASSFIINFEPGDINIISMATDDDGFSFVNWKEIPIDAELTFTDNAWNGSAALMTTESTMKWKNTTGSIIPIGTVILVTSGGTSTSTPDIGTNMTGAGTGSLTELSVSNENIFVYENTAANPYFIYGISNANWITSGSPTVNDSYLPTTINIANANIVLGTLDNYEYSASRENQDNYPVYKTMVNTTSNWTGNNTYFALSSTDFSLNAIWVSAAWSNSGVGPTISLNGIIRDNFVTATNGVFSAKQLTIDPTFTLTISVNTSVTITDAIVNNGIIEVQNTGSLVQVNDLATNTGTGTYQIKKMTSPFVLHDYTYFSSPVVGFDVSSLTGFDLKYYYDAGNYEDLYGSDVDGSYSPGFPQRYGVPDGFDDASLFDWQTASGVMNAGVGYIARGAAAQDSGLEVNFATGDSGRVHNGTYTVTVEKDGHPNAGGDSAAVLLSNNNANLIGNPYPSAINAVTFYNQNSTVINPTFYFWTSNTAIAQNSQGPWVYNYNNNDFATFNPSGMPMGVAATTGDPIPTGYIASGQGFLVSLLEGTLGTSVTFNNAQRTAGNNNQFFRLANNNDRIWLNFTTEAGEVRPIAIGFESEALDSYDLYDSPRMENGTDNDFYSLTDNGFRLAINRLSSFDVDKTVPLGLEIIQTGTHQIAIDHTEGIFTQGQAVYLEDKLLNVIHNLTAGVYSFTQTAGNDLNDRFELRFTAGALGTEELAMENVTIYPNPSKNIFNISNKGNEMPRITVFDINGKALFQSEQTNQIDLSNFSHGLYFAKLMYSTGQKTFKLFKE